MTKAEVMALLKANQNDRGIAHWQRMDDTAGLKSFGIGLTQLRKLAKQIGRNRRLAATLWRSDVYDARVIALLIDDPKQMPWEQAEAQVDQLHAGMLRHVFASCDATLAKTPFAVDLAVEWTESDDANRRCCGYYLLYEISKFKGRKAPDDAFFLDYIDRIQARIQDEENWVRDAMNGALLGIGKRSKSLNQAALRAARAIGPVEVDYGTNNCEPFDVVKHLTSDYLKKKFA